VTPGETTHSYAVEDLPPKGWTVGEINEEGQWDNVKKKVKWGPFFDNNIRSLFYKVTPNKDDTGLKTFSGKASFDGVSVAISGDSTIELAVLHPADTGHDFEISVDEVTAYGSAWKTGQTWPVPPNPIPVEYVTNAGYLWKVGEVYHYDQQASPPWVSGTGSGNSLRSNLSLQKDAALGTGSAIRDFPDCYTPNTPVMVSIVVTPGQGTQTYAVEETPPAGWTVSEISENGQWDSMNRKVKWGLFLDNNTRTLTYKVTPPLDETRTRTFSGISSFDGTNITVRGDLNFGKCTTSSITLQNPPNNTYFNACSLHSAAIFSWSTEGQFKVYEIQFDSDDTFTSPVKIKVSGNFSEVLVTPNIWKRVLLVSGKSGGTIYLKVIGTRDNKTTEVSEVRSIVIDPPQPVSNPNISSTNKNSLPELSWKNNCNTKFKVWFGNDPHFTMSGVKKKAISFNDSNPNDNGGIFKNGLTSGQWTSIRKLVKDTSGSTIYWYIESWDGLKRYNKSDVINFVLTE
jgi:hypothetical protein